MNRQQLQQDSNLLDRVLPLRDASHADVVSYDVDIPLRYSECRATLADGRETRLRKRHQFLGWQGLNGSRRLLFRCGEQLIEVRRGADGGPEARALLGEHRFVARDGSMRTATSGFKHEELPQ